MIKKAWVVAVNMGYGHQRTAHPLKKFAIEEKIINANDYKGIPLKDREIWESTRRFYEFISNFKRFPLVGEAFFYFFDKFQQIPTFYPHRDLSQPTFSLKKIFSLIKKGWGKDLIDKLKSKNKKIGANLPFITTFFTPAFMAEEFGYPGEIYCIICDADISRAWVSLNPKKTRIKYFAPNSWVINRLKLYGIREEDIFLTGYPLPLENIGDNMSVLKRDLAVRLRNLDPEGKYYKKYKPLIDAYIGGISQKVERPLTIMFSIGGAGAQKEMAASYVKSLRKKIEKGEIRVFLSAGIKKNVRDYFLRVISKRPKLVKNIEIIFANEISEYFDRFNKALRETDILWTKPSELSFYAGLGIPIIIAPSIGSQEDFNRKWLLRIGAGVLQENPRFAHQWIFDYLKGGRFADSAMEGFLGIEKLGVYNIERICFG